MSLISKILLAVIIVSLAGVAILMPFAICDCFFGRERAKKLLKTFNINIDCNILSFISIVLALVAIIAYIIRDNIS